MLLLIIITLVSSFIANTYCMQSPSSTSLEDAIFEAWKETFTGMDKDSITRQCMTANAITNDLIPMQITTPGLYCLGESLIPNRSVAYVISIQTDNVIVDLNENIIQGIGYGSGGIAIQSNNHSNIIIRGGTIKQFGMGITVGNGRSILLDTLTITNCNAGMLISNITEGVLQSCAFYSNSTAGFNMNLGQFVFLTNCVASRNGQGLVFANCANIILQQCIANNNNAQGFLSTAGMTFQFLSCTANGNNQGFVLDVTKKDSFAGCSSTDNTNNGFDLNGDSISMTSINAKGNSVGFNIRGTNSVIVTSLAETNKTAGFQMTSSSKFSFLQDNTALENGIGFNNLGTTNKLYTNFAFNNTTNFVNVPNVFVSPIPTDPINFTTNIAN